MRVSGVSERRFVRQGNAHGIGPLAECPRAGRRRRAIAGGGIARALRGASPRYRLAVPAVAVLVVMLGVLEVTALEVVVLEVVVFLALPESTISARRAALQ